ncbi:hypothetical protein BJ508DRAFT_320410 [Ascobolus immersus RN42]|uniref:Uncharacterized protein n=1 Tax=Ascobolus immersus RN42 TaxID=1160509 RepID=A0A3N4IT13_ASCIM|nr:hypothetical protein BJ508DRAFT_320410 [Ascobolus immersus RN42]
MPPRPASYARPATRQQVRNPTTYKRDRPLRIIAVCRAHGDTVADQSILADFLLFLMIFKHQPNIVRQRWIMHADPEEQEDALDGILHGQPEFRRKEIDIGVVRESIQERKLLVLDGQHVRRAVMNEISRNARVSEKDSDLLFISCCHGRGGLQGVGDPFFGNMVIWFDPQVPAGPQRRMDMISRDDLERAIQGTSAEVTLINVGCHAGTFRSLRYNLIGASNLDIANSHRVSGSGSVRGTLFAGALDDDFLRSEFTRGRRHHITNFDSMRDDIWEYMLTKTPANRIAYPILLTMSQDQQQGLSQGLQVPPRPVRQPVDLLYRPANDNPAQVAVFPVSQDPLEQLCRYYLSSKPPPSSNDEMIRIWIASFRLRKSVDSDSKRELRKKQLEIFLRYNRLWNTELSKFMKLKGFQIGTEGDYSIESLDIRMREDRLSDFSVDYPDLIPLIPQNPIYMYNSCGVCFRQVEVLRLMAKEWGSDVVANMLRESADRIGWEKTQDEDICY